MRVAVAFVLLVHGCRDPAPAPPDAAATPTSAPAEAAAPRHAEANPEAGALVNPLCEGMRLSLFENSCEVTDAEWAATPAPPPGALVQEAKLRESANASEKEVELALVNRTSKPVELPLRFDDRDLGRSFSVIAERTDRRGIYALASPHVNRSPSDASVHVHSTRIRLMPGGRASAAMIIDFMPTQRLDDKGAKVAPADLDGGSLEGSFTVHIGQLLSHVQMGDPATIRLSNGLHK